jgi:hypothetical protein
MGCQAVSGPNHDGICVFLALLAVTLLPVPSQSLLLWPRSELSQRGHGTWTSVACSVAQIAFLQLVLVLSLSLTMVLSPGGSRAQM